jgi:diaminohydroxyphosphoribosylaminopyrimidine deaminase/5-amino-6-(5-phosphoribosylamino)uracil reductase
MRLALVEAERARGQTRPNPMVGAVVVRGGRLVSTGYHVRAGLEHAEVVALREAGEAAQGATLYVNLEPCSHFGRTPPCADAIIAAGIRRVVTGMIDPNPRVSGNGIKRLRDAGIQVDVGVLEHECRRLNEEFITVMTLGRPFVTAKLAMSLDGRIATHDGDSRWISGEVSRQRVHAMRAASDAVLVGPRTLMADNPHLTVRHGQYVDRQPVRYAITPLLELPDGAHLLDGAARTVLVAANPPTERRAFVESRGVSVLDCPDEHGRVDLAEALRRMAADGVTALLVEGGGGLVGELVDIGAVDRLVLFMAPIVIGGRDAPGPVGGQGASRIEHALRARNVEIERSGDDLVVIADLR